MDYAIDFRTLATGSGWNNAALVDAFLHGLSPKIKDQLIVLEIPPNNNRIFPGRRLIISKY